MSYRQKVAISHESLVLLIQDTRMVDKGRLPPGFPRTSPGLPRTSPDFSGYFPDLSLTYH